MKLILALLATVTMPTCLQATQITLTFNTGFANDGYVPDGSPAGWQDHQTVTLGANQPITDVRVMLDLQGGWNGDLYGYLRHETASGAGLAVLLNRVGTPGAGAYGYGDPGFGPDASGRPFMLSDRGAFGIHNYQDYAPAYNDAGQLTGTWQPDGSSLANTFAGLDASGTWTLFLADASAGGESSVFSWGLQIETISDAGGASNPSVPDHTNTGAVMAATVALLIGVRRFTSPWCLVPVKTNEAR
jgi:hypothetical protein